MCQKVMDRATVGAGRLFQGKRFLFQSNEDGVRREQFGDRGEGKDTLHVPAAIHDGAFGIQDGDGGMGDIPGFH